MKNLIIFATLFLGNVSYADSARENQYLLANALASPQTQAAVAAYGSAVDFTENIKFENSEDVDVVTLKGVKLLGGDIPCGNAELKIVRAREFFGLGWKAIYKAETTITRSGK